MNDRRVASSGMTSSRILRGGWTSTSWLVTSSPGGRSTSAPPTSGTGSTLLLSGQQVRGTHSCCHGPLTCCLRLLTCHLLWLCVHFYTHVYSCCGLFTRVYMLLTVVYSCLLLHANCLHVVYSCLVLFILVYCFTHVACILFTFVNMFFIVDAGGMATSATLLITLKETNDYAPQLVPLSGTVCRSGNHPDSALLLTALDEDLAPHADPFTFELPHEMALNWTLVPVNSELLNDLSLYCLTPTCSLMTCLCTV